jgi:hypothetical protein
MAAAAALGLPVLGTSCGKGPEPALVLQVEARRLAADAQLRFAKAVEASNRAVMAGNDEAAAGAAKEAGAATLALRQQVSALHGVLESLDYPSERRILEQFETVLTDYMKDDEIILTLAVENTNVKAKRLAFGAARETVNAFRDALKILRVGTTAEQWRVRALVEGAIASVLDVQVAHARHVSEGDEPVMSALEAQITTALTAARDSLAELKNLAPRAAQPLTEAAAALESFSTHSAEIVRLSRLNTNIRSQALALGRKRTLATRCDELLTQLVESIIRRGVKNVHST